MAEFTGTATQLAKAMVMAQLLGDYFAKWGKAQAHEVAQASALADLVLEAASGPAAKPEALAPVPVPIPARVFPRIPVPDHNPAVVVPPTQDPSTAAGPVLDLSQAPGR